VNTKLLYFGVPSASKSCGDRREERNGYEECFGTDSVWLRRLLDNKGAKKPIPRRAKYKSTVSLNRAANGQKIKRLGAEDERVYIHTPRLAGLVRVRFSAPLAMGDSVVNAMTS
jgi:hypothetical protein